MTLVTLEFYSGIGGMSHALSRCAAALGLSYQVAMAFEINTNANTVYRANFGNPVAQRSIQDHSVEFFEKFKADLFLMSPPCQPYTRVGLQKGAADARSESFFFILELLRALSHPPTYILIENVKGFEISDTREQSIQVLQECGYVFQEFLLSPSQFGIPNSRLRYYMLVCSPLCAQNMKESSQVQTFSLFFAGKEAFRTLFCHRDVDSLGVAGDPRFGGCRAHSPHSGLLGHVPVVNRRFW